MELLKEKGKTVTTAESCTGGLVAGRLLNVPGASSVYMEGYITYSNEAKEKLLGVPILRWNSVEQSAKRRPVRWQRAQRRLPEQIWQYL